MSIFNPEFGRRIRGIDDDEVEDDLGLTREKPDNILWVPDIGESVLETIEGEDEKDEDIMQNLYSIYQSQG